MMTWWFIIGLAVSTYLLRLGGIWFAARYDSATEPEGSLSAGVVGLLPIALLAAVAVTQVAPGGGAQLHLITAAVVAGIVRLRFGFLTSVLVGGIIGALTGIL